MLQHSHHNISRTVLIVSAVWYVTILVCSVVSQMLNISVSTHLPVGGYQNSIYRANGGTDQTLTPDEQFLYTPMGSTSLMSEYFWNILGKTQEENHTRFIGSVNPYMGHHPWIEAECPYRYRYHNQ